MTKEERAVFAKYFTWQRRCEWFAQLGLLILLGTMAVSAAWLLVVRVFGFG